MGFYNRLAHDSRYLSRKSTRWGRAQLADELGISRQALSPVSLFYPSLLSLACHFRVVLRRNEFEPLARKRNGSS